MLKVQIDFEWSNFTINDTESVVVKIQIPKTIAIILH